MLKGFIGVCGYGKDHRSTTLVAEGHWRKVDFKDALLDMASDLCGYDVREDYDWFKEHAVGFGRNANPFIGSFEGLDHAQLLRRHSRLLTGRRLLQRLGTEVMRKRDQDYWVKAWIIKAEEARKAGFDVCVADCRFRNEAEVILANGGELVFCDYHSNRYDAGQAHESEHLAQRMLALGLKDGDAVTAGLL